MSTTIEAFGSTSLIEDGGFYFLQPNDGSAVELRYDGSPVAVGQFGQWSRLPRSRRRTDIKWPGNRPALINIWRGTSTAAAIASQVRVTPRPERAPR